MPDCESENVPECDVLSPSDVEIQAQLPQAIEPPVSGEEESVADDALTLLERLDRRQNLVMHELDALDRQIQSLVKECQLERRDSSPEEAA